MTATTTGRATSRTSQEIAQSRKEARAFFAGLSHASATRIERIRAEGALSPNLSLLLFTVSEWQNPTEVRAKALRNRWQRIDENLKPYIGVQTRQTLPAPRFQNPEPENIPAIRRERSNWRTRVNNPSATLHRRLAREEKSYYRRWVLEQAKTNRPVGTGGLSVVRATEKAPLTSRYIPGKINPAGMTPERALEIALSVLP